MNQIAGVMVGVQTSSLGLPFRQALPKIAAMGAKAVELDARYELRASELTETGIRQIRKWLDDHNLKVSAVSFRTRRGYDVDDDLQKRIDATKEAMRLAYRLGASSVINQVGRIEMAEANTPAGQMLRESLTDLGNASQRIGTWLAMETGTESGEEMRKLIDELPDGSVRVNFDPGNLIINGFSATEAVKCLAPHIAHVHARDAVRDLARGRGLEVQLGRGSVDFPEILGTLEEYNYRGYLTVVREAEGDVRREIEMAVQYLANIYS